MPSWSGFHLLPGAVDADQRGPGDIGRSARSGQRRARASSWRPGPHDIGWRYAWISLRAAGPQTGHGAVARGVTDADIAAGREGHRYDNGNVEVVVPCDQFKAWLATCTYGWTGPELPATAAPDGDRHCTEEIEDLVLYPAWRQHSDPMVALSDLTNQLRDLERQMGEKVQLARSAGVSWGDIGYQVGMTRQGAQQRWGAAAT